VTGLVARRRQRRSRPRIAYATKPSTIRIISTHNHPGMAASLVGAAAVRGDATAYHPGKQLPRAQAASRLGIGGRAARGLAGIPGPATCPPIWAGRGGCQTGPVLVEPPLRAHDCSLAPSAPGLTAPGLGPAADHAGGAEPSGHALQAQPNRIDQHHKRGGPGRRQPTRRDHSEPDRWAMARPRGVCPAWVGEQCKHGYAETQWQAQRSHRRTDGARLRRNLNVRRGRLHRLALPV